MSSTLLIVAVVIGVAALYRAPPRWSLTLVLTVAFLVPTEIVVPHSPSSQFTVVRVAVAAFGLGAVVRACLDRDEERFRPTRMHLVLGLVLVATFVLGVVLAGPAVTTRASLRDWWSVLEDVVFFAAVLAVLRQVDLWWAARVAASVVVLTGLIAVVEHVTRSGYAALWFGHLHQLPGGDSSVPKLQTRGGQVRVQAASLFALEFAWVCTMWLPLVSAVALWSRRRIALLAPVVMVAVIAWTYSRSVWPGLVVGGLVFVACSRADRRVLRAVIVAAVLALAAVAASPSLRSPFHAADTAASSASRVTRAEQIAHALAGHPYRGLGFGGLALLGLKGADMSYVWAYAQLGVIGVVIVVILFATAAGEALAGLRIPKGRERGLAAAAISGIVLAVIASAAYDFIAIEQSMLTLMFLTAFAIALRERYAGPRARPVRAMPVMGKVAAVAAGVAIGAGVWITAPRHWAGTWRIETVLPRRLDEENSSGHEDYPGTILVNTVCHLVDQAAMARGNVKADCPVSFANPLGAGFADVRVAAPSRAEVQDVTAEVFDQAARYIPGFAVQVLEPVARATPTVARTAPLAGGLLGLALALLLPVPEPSGGAMELGRPGSGLRQRRGAGLPSGGHGGVLEPLVPGGDEDPVGQ